MQSRIAAVLARVFKIPAAAVSRESGPHSFSAWDSAGHLNLVLALEQEFGVTFDDDEVVELISVDAIEAALQKHGAAT